MQSLSGDYSELVLEHFHAPRNAGSFPAGTEQVIEGRAGDKRLGREIVLELRLDAGKVAECRYRVYGCPATVALCSLLSERLRGQDLAGLAKVAGLPLVEELGLPPAKRAAALVLEDALESALARYNMTSRRQTA